LRFCWFGTLYFLAKIRAIVDEPEEPTEHDQQGTIDAPSAIEHKHRTSVEWNSLKAAELDEMQPEATAAHQSSHKTTSQNTSKEMITIQTQETTETIETTKTTKSSTQPSNSNEEAEEDAESEPPSGRRHPTTGRANSASSQSTDSEELEGLPSAQPIEKSFPFASSSNKSSKKSNTRQHKAIVSSL
jgi:hypothetical protein